LSSWLNRVAICYHMEVSELLEHDLGHAQVDDLDTAPPLALLAMLSQRSGIEPDRLRAAPIPGFREAIVSGQTLYVSDDGRYVFIPGVNGALFDIRQQKNLSEASLASLRRELLPYGVDVIVVAPGAVATPIWGKAEEQDITAYANTVYAAPLERLQAYMLGLGAKGLPPERIGEAIHTALTAAKPKVRYTISPDPLQTFMSEKVLSKRGLDRIVGKRLGLLPE